MHADLLTPGLKPWQERLATILDTMREMSRHTDPQKMVQSYIARVNQLFGTQRLDDILGHCATEPSEILKAVLAAVEVHTHAAAPTDDRTLVVGRVL